MQKTAVEMSREAMRERLAAKPEIADFLVPSFAVGCRRTTPGPGYLEALVEDNVDFITDPIEAVNAGGVALRSGRQVDVDCLVCATGFTASGLPPFPVVGLGGRSLADRFTPHPEAYMSLAVDGFPNLFLVLGPNSAVGSGSLTMILEAQGDYIVKCVRKLQRDDYAAMRVRPARVADWAAYCAAYFRDTVYTDACRSWYRSDGGRGGRVTGLWPGSTLHALEALRAPRWEDYEWEPRDGANGLAWLGNGSSLANLRDPATGAFGGDPAWYLEPGFQDVPVPGRPEDDPAYRTRCFSA